MCDNKYLQIFGITPLIFLMDYTMGMGNLIIQSGRSPKVVALFSATNFSSDIIELLQLEDAIEIQWNYARIHYNIAKRIHLMI